MKLPQASQCSEELRGLPHLPTQLAGAAIDVFYFPGRIAFGNYLRGAQGQLEREFLLDTLKSVREGVEQLQPLAEMADGFHMSRAFSGPLSSLLPVRDGLRRQPCFGVVMG